MLSASSRCLAPPAHVHARSLIPTCRRCKLFRLVAGEWKERGTGNAKLLRHRVTGKVRLVMRQEKTLKVCANHLVDPATELKVMTGSDRSWMWGALDAAEGETPKTETFALRLKDSEQATEFHKAWEDARAANAAALSGKVAPAPAAKAAAAAPHVDTSGPIPVSDNLDTIYGTEASVDAAVRFGKVCMNLRASPQ